MATITTNGPVPCADSTGWSKFTVDWAAYALADGASLPANTVAFGMYYEFLGENWTAGGGSAFLEFFGDGNTEGKPETDIGVGFAVDATNCVLGEAGPSESYILRYAGGANSAATITLAGTEHVVIDEALCDASANTATFTGKSEGWFL